MIDREPLYEQRVDQIGQLQTDIIAYHEALKTETGLENPNVLIDDLFAWTGMEYHNDLRSAIWNLTEKDWSVTLDKNSPEGDFHLALSHTPGSFSYF